MSILDKVVSAVTPTPSAEERAEARRKALADDGGAGWLAAIVEHHIEIDAAFAAVYGAGDAASRRQAQKWLATLLAGHSIAEETVIYPAMALTTQKAHSSAAYTEQSAAKVQVAALDDLQPMSQDYLDKLAHLQSAVTHHVYEEESKWFPELRKEGQPGLQARLLQRYREEFERYMGRDLARAESKGSPLPASMEH